MARKTPKGTKGAKPGKPKQRPVAQDVDPDVDPGLIGVDRPPIGVDRPELNGRQRRFVEFLLADPERNLSQAAWRAGYCGGSPEAPYPEADRKRKTIAQAASRLATHPAVVAHRDELERRAAAVFMASPEAAPIREQLAARAAGEADLEKLAATNLAVMVAIAHHDVRSAVTWGPGWVEVTESADLTYEEQLLVREVEHEETYNKEGGITTTTRVKLADRVPYVKMLEQRVGKFAPLKHEVSGPGGGRIPVGHEHQISPSDEMLDSLAEGLLGVVPAARARPDAGVPLADIGKILRAWELDGNAHVTEPADLFSEEHWHETRTRYLGDQD